MSYTKHNFQSGAKLYANELNEMDEQIYKNTEQIANSDSTELRKYVEEQMGEVVLDVNMTEAFDFYAGYLNKSGNTVANAPSGTTDFIPVEIGDVFVWSGTIDINNGNAVCIYDAE